MDRAVTDMGLNLAQAQAPRILYMEDDPGLARLLKKHLGRYGYQVDLAADGAEGLSLVEKNRYQAVLVDYNMPVLGGMEVVRHLVAREQRLPVVMITGNGDEQVAVEAMKLGAADYLVKDLDMGYLELLPMVLDKVLLGGRLAAEREQALRSIRESEERYRKLVELSPDGIVICCRSRIEFVNPAALRLLGAGAAAEVLGHLILGFVHPGSVHLFQAQLELIETSGVNVPWVEERFVRLDYGELDVEVSGIPFVFGGKQAVQIIFRDITARVESTRLLERMAFYDQLTRLPNRVLFFERVSVTLLQAKRYEFPLALLYLDLDHFKQINDTLGHDKGDELLRQVAARLVHCSRSSDTVARMGGDEFVILVSRMKDQDNAAIVARKVIDTLNAPFNLGGELCSIGASIGISLHPADADDADDLVKKADHAMYVAKQQGGNCFIYFRELKR
jgi:diguanylate cyclase (GGDEF)-like protein/PAS domain S-box-containing protein